MKFETAQIHFLGDVLLPLQLLLKLPKSILNTKLLRNTCSQTSVIMARKRQRRRHSIDGF